MIVTSLHSLAEDDMNAPPLGGYDFLMERDGYHVRLADSFDHRSKASLLIEQRYSSRGYTTKSIAESGAYSPNVITLVASANEQLFGTLSVGIDSPQGLLADELYREEIDKYRKRGRKVGEFSRLAIDPEQGSKEVLASLFHLAYIQLGPILGVTDAFIEVNPRHAPFYRRMLGFSQIGETRNCPRVNAPAMLLHLDMSHAAAQICRFGGTRDARERSLYPFFFSQHEEEGLVRRNFRLSHADRRRKPAPATKPLDWGAMGERRVPVERRMAPRLGSIFN